MTEAIIRSLRRLQALEVITSAHCIRAERYVERHAEIFSNPSNMTVSQAVELALEFGDIAHLDLR